MLSRLSNRLQIELECPSLRVKPHEEKNTGESEQGSSFGGASGKGKDPVLLKHYKHETEAQKTMCPLASRATPSWCESHGLEPPSTRN